MFLYLIAIINIIILAGILKVFRDMRSGTYNEAELEEHLNNRGFMNRFFGRIMKSITKPWQMFPIGVLFGLGFDTATEVALLVLAGTSAAAGLPWYAILCLPVLFAAGMSLLDTIDGSFMNFAVRLGVLQTSTQGLLQHHHHRTVGSGRPDHRHHRTARPARQPTRLGGRLLGLGRRPEPQHPRLRSSSDCSC